jgi:low temperature requirement protein LtrA
LGSRTRGRLRGRPDRPRTGLTGPPPHFAERHGLIVIIALGESIVALGESIVAIGVGAVGVPLTPGIVSAAVLGIVVIAALWWAYLDVYAVLAQRQLSETSGATRALLARDYYTYLHLPMIAGIVLFALGPKETIEQVASRCPRSPRLRSAVGSRCTISRTSPCVCAWYTSFAT